MNSKACALGIFVWLMSSVVWARAETAVQNNENRSSDLTSLNYYPHRGFFEIDPHLTTTLTDTSFSSTGASSKIAYNQFYAGLNYGLKGGVRLSLSENLLWDQLNDALTAKDAETSSVESGLSNPTLGIAWRYLESELWGLSGDLSAQISPSLGPKVTGDGSVQMPGNNLSGNWTEEVLAALYCTAGLNQIKLQFALTENGEITNRTSTGTARTTSYLTSNLTLAERYHLSPHQFIQLELEWLPKNHHSGLSATDSGTRTDNPASFSETVLFGFEPDPAVVVEIAGSLHNPNSALQNASGNSTSTAHLLATTITLLHAF